MISTYKEHMKRKLFPWYRKQINEKAHFRYHMDECYCNFIKNHLKKLKQKPVFRNRQNNSDGPDPQQRQRSTMPFFKAELGKLAPPFP